MHSISAVQIHRANAFDSMCGECKAVNTHTASAIVVVGAFVCISSTQINLKQEAEKLEKYLCICKIQCRY